jgi:hypothetical protein
MKTTYITMAILATTLFSQTAVAKLGANPSTVQLNSNIQINIEAEIVDNINQMLGNLQAPTIKNDIVKQLNIDTVQSQTNELVQDIDEKLPEFKFKVVIAD